MTEYELTEWTHGNLKYGPGAYRGVLDGGRLIGYVERYKIRPRVFTYEAYKRGGTWPRGARGRTVRGRARFRTCAEAVAALRAACEGGAVR